MTHLRMLRIIVNKRWWAPILNFVTVVKYSLTINIVKENIHTNLLFSFNTSGCKTRRCLIQYISRFSRWKSLHRQFCSMMRIFILLKSSRLWSDSLEFWLTGGNVLIYILEVFLNVTGTHNSNNYAHTGKSWRLSLY